MKHKLSITLIILGMFLATQFIGLFIINAYSPIQITNPESNETIQINETLPYGLDTPNQEATPNFISILLSFILAFALISLLIKYKWKSVIRIWFFLVITLALAISINAILKTITLLHYYTITLPLVALTIALPLSAIKIFKPNFYIHNLTELLIYPGIAAVFVPILNPTSIIILLILISLYDAWAVWHSGIMQKMAKFQMEEIKIFGGFMIPSASKKVKKEIQTIKQKYKNKKIPKSIKDKKFKIKLAILGGGDVIFPIITAGVFMRAFGIIPALFIIAGALGGLIAIFYFSKKDKAYPAMPYITTGIFVALIIWKIFL